MCLMDSVFVGAFFVIPLLFLWQKSRKPASLMGRHVLVTGGSSGIGKWVAIEAVRRGANVSLLARDVNKLEAARELVLKHCQTGAKNKQKVCCFSVDVSKDYSAVEKVVSSAEEELGPVYLLVNSAGTSVSGKFEDIPLSDFENLINVNYIGSVYTARAVVPKMKTQGKGHVVFVSSQAGLVGLYGYTAYSASKFALLGLAEALSMEVKPYGVSVTVSFPPDTDTPGFHLESETKPEETQLISETAGLLQPEEVAKGMLDDCLHGKFLSTLGLEGFLLTITCAGMSPVPSALELMIQVFGAGLCRLVSVFYLLKFNWIVKKCMKNRNQNKKSE